MADIFFLICNKLDATLAPVRRLFLRNKGVHFGERVRLVGNPIVSLYPSSQIEIGDDTVLCSRSSWTAFGIAHPVVLRTLGTGARLKIGKHCGISGGSFCAATSIEIGDYCLFGADVQIVDTDFHPLAAESRRYLSGSEFVASAAVVIEDNVFLGAGVRVLKGVRIGKDSVIGAGAVVTSDIPSGVIAVGVPAKVIRPVPVK